MKRPQNTEELLKGIFFWLGFAFGCMAGLSKIGLLQPTSGSGIQDPVVLRGVFLAVALAFGTGSFLLGSLAARKQKRHRELLANGTAVKGCVERIYLQRSVQYGNRSPYRVCYSYTYQDNAYHHKSGFLWEEPKVMVGNTIVVYTDDRGRSAIEL